MAVSPADELGGAERPSWPWLTLASDAILRTYAQILFSRSRRVGALLLLATALAPRVAVYGLAAVTLAFLVTRVFRLGDELTAEGSFGYNALLVGLGVGALFGPTPDAHVIAVVGVVTAVFMSAALYSALGATFALPPLTLPFLFVFYLVLGSARLLDVPLLAGRDFDGGDRRGAGAATARRGYGRGRARRRTTPSSSRPSRAPAAGTRGRSPTARRRPASLARSRCTGCHSRRGAA